LGHYAKNCNQSKARNSNSERQFNPSRRPKAEVAQAKQPSPGKRAVDGSKESFFHLATPANAVQNYLTVPIIMDHTTPTVLVQIQGVKRTLILDSGSCCSVLQPGLADEPMGCTEFVPFGVTGKNLDVKGEQSIKFLMGSVTFSLNFVVCKLPTNAAGILGINFLLPRRAKLNCEDRTLTLHTGQL
jgi:hypothetical protein